MSYASAASLFLFVRLIKKRLAQPEQILTKFLLPRCMRTWHGSHADPAESFDDRCSAESALRPFDQQSRRDDAVPDRSIVRREKWNSSCDRQFRYRVRVIFDARSVGVVEDMRAKYLIGHFEFSRSRYPLIIRFESGARRKITTVRRIADLSRPRPARYAALTRRCLSWNQ
jgi:hypothetical protein